jgi:tetratricopeptide (TPR) repeat protein
LFQARDWREATKECRAALRLIPADLLVRKLLVRCELRLGNHQAALKEFQTLLAFDPPNRDELLRRFPSLSSTRSEGR